jgi:hypothetical protein
MTQAHGQRDDQAAKDDDQQGVAAQGIHERGDLFAD